MRRIVTAILVLGMLLVGTGTVRYAHLLQHAIASGHGLRVESDHSGHHRHHDPHLPGQSDDCKLCVQLHQTAFLPAALAPSVLVLPVSDAPPVSDDGAPIAAHVRRCFCRGPPRTSLPG